jgi:hypothetical protein
VRGSKPNSLFQRSAWKKVIWLPEQDFYKKHIQLILLFLLDIFFNSVQSPGTSFGTQAPQ